MKKKVQKTEINKTKSKKITLYAEVTPEKYFILCDGRPVKNIKELATILENVGEDVFAFHVNAERNDFANWIKDVFDEHEFADTLRSVKTRADTVAKIYKHLYEKVEKMLPK